jgi:hypothetical protein
MLLVLPLQLHTMLLLLLLQGVCNNRQPRARQPLLQRQQPQWRRRRRGRQEPRSCRLLLLRLLAALQ